LRTFRAKGVPPHVAEPRHLHLAFAAEQREVQRRQKKEDQENRMKKRQAELQEQAYRSQGACARFS
jgi:hypothetical protein